jgi:hypothetical protein
MGVSAFELLKNNDRTNFEACLQNTPLLSYGRITEVIDIQTVMAEAVVQASQAKEEYLITLLNASSASLDISVYPKLGDTVLIFFLQRYDPKMFAVDWAVGETVNNGLAVGYNRFSGVGILASTVKDFADTVLHFYESGGEARANLKTGAAWFASFNSRICLYFLRAAASSDDEALISTVFGEGRPFFQQHLSSVLREHGFWQDGDGNLVELDASVTERYSEYAPITKDIQGSQTYTIGTGTQGPTHAPVTVYLDGDADVTISSKGAFRVTVKKDLDFESDKPIGIKGTGTQLGSGALQVLYNALQKFFLSHPIMIPPIFLFPGMPLLPAPPFIVMYLFELQQAFLSALQEAMANTGKAIK